jgi:hypothetical protein
MWLAHGICVARDCLRNSFGEIPLWPTKERVKLDEAEKPKSIAICVMDESVSIKAFFANGILV